MKNVMSVLKLKQGTAGIAAFLIILSPMGYAEDTAATTESETQSGPRRERFEKFLEQNPDLKTKLDTNQDGTVDQQEMRQGRSGRREEFRNDMKEKYDTNKDGKVDRDEFEAMRGEKRDKFFENHPEAKERLDSNADGKVDRGEWKEGRKAFGRDRDNNPPGMAGGPGTNWENRPGPQGGQGAGPDRRGNGPGFNPYEGQKVREGGPGPGAGFRKDRDNNPPGKRGGPGTNWENRPGPQGGPGAGPNRGPRKQK